MNTVYLSLPLSCICLALPTLGQDQPQYYLSPHYYVSGAPEFRDVSDNRTLTAVTAERDWTQAGGPETGNLLKLRTTGAFSSSPVALVTTSKILLSKTGTYPRTIGFKYLRMPTTEAGDVLLMVGNLSSNGLLTASAGAIWKADDSVVTLSVPAGANNLVPRDMNENLQTAVTVMYEYVDQFDRTLTRPVPVKMYANGTSSAINPGRVERWGFETVPNESNPSGRPKVVLNNGAHAVAINNQGAVVCDAYGLIWHEGSEQWRSDEWSFVYNSDAVQKDDLPQGATDINDLGEVVGYNRFEGTWLYLPSGNYGMAAGVHIIDPLIYRETDGESSRYNIQPLINNRGDVVWRGAVKLGPDDPEFPEKLWRAGHTYLLTELYTTSETFDVLETVELNEKGDIMIRTYDYCDYGSVVTRCWSNRILSLTPFETDLIVNVTDDTEDADPNDKVVDVDLETAGLQVSLRAAINAVNEGSSDKIKFDIEGDSVPVIILIKALPAITRPVMIDGTTQAAGQVEIRGGANAGAGFQLQGGESEVKGMVMHGFTGQDAAAIRISGPGGNKIFGNRLGTDALGNTVEKTQFGVLIDGSPNNEIGGEAAGEGNVIYGETAGIRIEGTGADANQILGNRIGIATNGNILTPIAGYGIETTGGNDTVIGRTGAGSNLIAGNIGIGSGNTSATSGLAITGNRIGLNGAGTAGANGFAGILLVGVPGGELSSATIAENKIAGQMVNLLLLGTENKLSNIDITGNDIGLAFDGSDKVPAGMLAGVQGYGIRLDGGHNIKIFDNMIAGHTWNILSSGIPQVFIGGGVDTDGDGEPDSDFRVQFLDPTDSLTPDEGQIVAGSIVIEKNYIGIDRSNRITPGGLVQRTGLANYGGANGTTIKDNIVGANTESGVLILDSNHVTMSGNRIGVSTGGLALPNGLGVAVHEASVTITDTIIAHNLVGGIAVTDDLSAMSFLGGSIYSNGNGDALKGIAYSTEPFSAPGKFIALRSPPKADGTISVAFALPPLDPPGGGVQTETTLEIWGNRSAGESQGYTRLLSEAIDPAQAYSKKFEVASDSFYATAQNFTATLTRGNKTSPFTSKTLPESIVWPELNFTPLDEGGPIVKADEVSFSWPTPARPKLFVIEQALSPTGPWIRVVEVPVESNGTSVITLPLSAEDEYFRLVLDPNSLIGNDAVQLEFGHGSGLNLTFPEPQPVD